MVSKMLMFLAVVVATVPAYSSDARTNSASGQPRILKTQNAKITSQVKKIPQGSVLKVVLRNKTKLYGRLGEVSLESFRLQTFDGERIQDRTIAFDEVKKVSVSKHAGGWNDSEAVPLVAGTAVGAGLLTVIILAAVGAL